MAIIDIFSKRQKQIRGETPDVYQYTEIPRALRVQIVHILRDIFGHHQDYDLNGCLRTFRQISDLLSREYGMFALSKNGFVDDQVVDFVLNIADCEQVLDVVEVSFRLASILANRHVEWNKPFSQQTLDDAISELNARFREHGVGFQYESREVIRVDSQLIHAEVVKPVLALLGASEYAGANAEFLKAFEHYRKGDAKECLNECLKSFESTMKAICKKRGWAYNRKDTAAALIEVCFKNGLIPTLIQSHIGAVRSALESGVPTIRNRLSGHGQGATITDVPVHYASYMLHLTATTIKFLVDCEKAVE